MNLRQRDAPLSNRAWVIKYTFLGQSSASTSPWAYSTHLYALLRSCGVKNVPKFFGFTPSQTLSGCLSGNTSCSRRALRSGFIAELHRRCINGPMPPLIFLFGMCRPSVALPKELNPEGPGGWTMLLFTVSASYWSVTSLSSQGVVRSIVEKRRLHYREQATKLHRLFSLF